MEVLEYILIYISVFTGVSISFPNSICSIIALDIRDVSLKVF